MVSSLQAGQSLVGQTGISYHLQKIIYERQEKHSDNTNYVRALWLARSNNESYAIKPVSPLEYDRAFFIRKDLSFCPFVRLPLDGNDAHKALIFQHYTEDFLKFMWSGPVSRPQVKRILFDLLRGLAACHSKDWVHCDWWGITDVKPNNVLISHTSKPDGTREIHGVSLSDLEDASMVKDGEAIFAQVGNVLWRSPEAQAGSNVGKASDVWSFGVTALYGITKMVIFDYGQLLEGVLPEIEVLTKMISYFGPLSMGLVNHLRDSPWVDALVAIDQSFNKDNPRRPIRLWKDIDGLEPGDKEFFQRILNLDPALRPTVEELLNDPWFHSP